ncbi:MAG: NUDIX domain-containing protein [Candidatus Paceibacterota bacterium]|jgi:8-oxo-dGTP diphosphatase
MEKRPLVGIGVMILKDGKILLGKRNGSFGAGEYAFPGGHLEYMESFFECARRETKEETGIEICNIKFQYLANLKDYSPKHFIQVAVIADWKSGEPEVMESNKCDGWGWYDLGNLPAPLFLATKLGIDSYKEGFIFRDLE